MRLLWGRDAQGRVPALRTVLPGALTRGTTGRWRKGARYRAAGQRYLQLFVELGGLQPDHAVLEPGCGIGRMAEPLTGYLSPAGSYDGFDVMPEAIEACVKHVGSGHPNFRFRHVDVANSMYNRGGRLEPHSFAFPYPDESFDLVFLTSVFTHMLPPGVRHYLREIRRVLRPGRRALMTFFLLDAESMADIRDGRAKRRFAYEGDDYSYDVRGRPEAAVAYREQDALSFLEDAGLMLDGPIRHGGWRGRGGASTAQDVVVVKRSD